MVESAPAPEPGGDRRHRRVWATPPRTGTWVRRGPLWVEGCSFPTWEHDAIPAHLGRLLAYALPAGQGTPAQQQLIAHALAIRPLPAAFRGAPPGCRPEWPLGLAGLIYAEAGGPGQHTCPPRLMLKEDPCTRLSTTADISTS